jgi:hypothetical protein
MTDATLTAKPTFQPLAQLVSTEQRRRRRRRVIRWMAYSPEIRSTETDLTPLKVTGFGHLNDGTWALIGFTQ